MGLYLAIFNDNEEIEGVEIGLYSDFNYMRDVVVNELEDGQAGSKYPILNLHSDCDGIWTVEDAIKLEKELKDICSAFVKLSSVEFNSDWQRNVAKSLGLVPKNLLECFIDVDGELLLERFISLSEISQQKGLPILFQ
jgi:hypothetical protein